MKPRSPIEMMVDKACGFDSSKYEPPAKVKLYCPKCKKTKQTTLEPKEPHQTVTIHLHCPECIGDDFEQISFYDKDGKELTQHSEP